MANETLLDRAKRLDVVLKGTASIALALEDNHIGKENRNLSPVPTSDASFINAWLRPDLHGSLVNSSAHKSVFSLTPNQADLRLASILGTKLYNKVQSISAEINVRPYQYAQVLTWWKKEYAILEAEITPFLERSCFIILEQAIKLRESSVASLTTFYQSLGVASKLESFTQDLAMYITLRQEGPLLDVAGLSKIIGSKTLEKDETKDYSSLVWDSARWEKEKLKDSCTSDKAPKLGWQHTSWRSSVIDGFYKAVTHAILKHLGVKSVKAGRALLVAKTPEIGMVSHLFTPWEIIDTVFQKGNARTAGLQRQIKRIIKRQNESIEALKKDEKDLYKNKDWSRYAPVVKLVLAAYRYQGMAGIILDKFESDVIPKPKAKPINKISSVLTVTGIVLAFIPPAALAGALIGIADAAVNVGIKIVEIQEAREDNKARATIIAGKPASAEALDLVEAPKSTSDLEFALAVELIFGAFALKDSATVLKNAYTKTTKKTVGNTAKSSSKKQVKEASAGIVKSKRKQEISEVMSRTTSQAKRGTERPWVHPQPKTKAASTARLQSGDIPSSNSTLEQLKLGASETTYVPQKISEAELKDLSDFVNGVTAKPTPSAKKAHGAVDAQHVKTEVLQGKNDAAQAKISALKKQRELEQSAPKSSEAIRIRGRIKAIDKRLANKQLDQAERIRLEKMRDDLDQKIQKRESLKAVRGVTGVSARRIGTELEKNGKLLFELKGEIKKERSLLAKLQAQLEKSNQSAKAKIKEKMASKTSRVSSLNIKVRALEYNILNQVETLLYTDGGQAILTELTKRGILNLSTGSDMLPEIQMLGEVIKL